MPSTSSAAMVAPPGGLHAASIVVVALLAGAVLLVWWASRPSVVARYGARRPAADGAQPPARPVPGGTASLPLAPGESDHAGH